MRFVGTGRKTSVKISRFLLAVSFQSASVAGARGSATARSSGVPVSSSFGTGAGRMNESTGSFGPSTFCGGISPRCSAERPRQCCGVERCVLISPLYSLRRRDAAKRLAMYFWPSIVVSIMSSSSTTSAISESPSPWTRGQCIIVVLPTNAPTFWLRSLIFAEPICTHP